MDYKLAAGERATILVGEPQQERCLGMIEGVVGPLSPILLLLGYVWIFRDELVSEPILAAIDDSENRGGG